MKKTILPQRTTNLRGVIQTTSNTNRIYIYTNTNSLYGINTKWFDFEKPIIKERFNKKLETTSIYLYIHMQYNKTQIAMCLLFHLFLWRHLQRNRFVQIVSSVYLWGNLFISPDPSLYRVYKIIISFFLFVDKNKCVCQWN